MYTGQYCEHVQRYIIVRQYVSKSFAAIAIGMICSVMVFIITLDVLKYVFHIDVSRKELEGIRQKKWRRKPKRQTAQAPHIAIRFVYVNKLPVNEQIIATTAQ
jgi:hypothetical protein